MFDVKPHSTQDPCDLLQDHASCLSVCADGLLKQLDD